MKRVLTNLQGGLPFTLDELEFIQDNIKTMTSGLGKGLSFGDTTIKVYGAEVTITNPGAVSPTFVMTAGLFYYANELYLIDAIGTTGLPTGTTQASFDTLYFFDLSQVQNNPVIFNDALTKNINQIRKAVLTTTPTTWVGLNYGSSLSVIDKIYDILPSATTSERGLVELASGGTTIAGTNLTDATTPSGVRSAILNHIPLRQAVLDIGSWNFTATVLRQVGHGLNYSNIRSVRAFVRNDADDEFHDLGGNTVPSSTVVYYGHVEYNRTVVKLTLVPSGLDGALGNNSDYSNTGGYNRGWIIIDYIP